MRILSTLALCSLMFAGIAGADTPPAANTATVKPATAQVAQKHPSMAACRKQADAKSLTGKERDSFLKDCHDGKTSEKK